MFELIDTVTHADTTAPAVIVCRYDRTIGQTIVETVVPSTFPKERYDGIDDELRESLSSELTDPKIEIGPGPARNICIRLLCPGRRGRTYLSLFVTPILRRVLKERFGIDAPKVYFRK